MMSFAWNFPTKLAYGEGNLAQVGKLTAGFGKKAFVTTYENMGPGQWILDTVLESLRKEGSEFEVYNAIEPNPRVSTIDKGVEKFLAWQCDFILAVGGGSVIDAAKYIAATAFSGGSCWDYVILAARKEKIYTGAYPIVAVPTVAASGSEANAGGVITNWETKEKSFCRSEYRIPKMAIIDPKVFCSLPAQVTADGGIDIFSHLIEHYLSSTAESEIADRITEGLSLTVIEYLDRALRDGKDIEARGQLSLCSIFGWSGLQALGRTGSIPIHFLEHQFSGHYDISHGRGIAILIPAFLEYFQADRPARWAKLARRVFGVTEKDDLKAAGQLHVRVRQWFKSVNMDLHFSDIGIDDSKFGIIADDILRMYGTLENGTKVPGPRPMSRADILNVLALAR